MMPTGMAPSIQAPQPVIQNQSNQDKILQLWQMVKNSNDQQKTINQLMSSNPEFANVMNAINALGDPKTTFYKRAEQMGKDPNAIINLLNSV